MLLHKILFCTFFLFIQCNFWSQGGQSLQNLRGKIDESETHIPLMGALVRVYVDTVVIGGVVADEQGNYIVNDVPVGRISVHISLLGYIEKTLTDIIIISGKEMIMNISLDQSVVEVSEVEITATREAETNNVMGTVSSRQFSVDETNRYAGSRGDPARMASNFAGVQGADDSRNDIVIRGNSPQGVLWRVEGVDIPNPNHFNIPGTAGGPVSIINNKYLANSDFYTGAFPADYGNSIAGVFDLRLRNGNNKQHEFTGQFGFLGTEIMAEGPISRSRGSSYLIGYRYSTVGLFSLAGIDIGTDAIPKYQDANFRVFLPGKNNSSLAIWGIGGMSSVDILISNQKSKDQRNIYGQNDRDQYFKTRMGVGGITWSKTISEKSFFKLTCAAMTDVVDSYHELVYRHTNSDSQYVLDSLKPLLDYTFRQNKISTGVVFNHKLNRKNLLRFGVNADYFMWNMVDSVRSSLDDSSLYYNQWTVRWNNKTNAALIQPYIQWRCKFTEALVLTTGLHSSLFTLNNSVSYVEPRLALKWQFHPRQHIAFATGLHSAIQPTYMYFYLATTNADSLNAPRKMLNRNMSFTRSTHLVASYQLVLKRGIRILSEIYFQQLSRIPIEVESSSFSLVNTGAGFSRFFPRELDNNGTGRNYGLELTVEKFYKNGWLFLVTGSLFDSKYRGSDGVERNTDFNGGYAFNVLGSKEFKIKERSALIVGAKVTTAGGRWYGPADIQASNAARDLVYVDSLRNSIQFDPYFRFDIKLNLRLNASKTTHEIGLDLVNVLNTKNVLSLTYAPNENEDPNQSIRKEYQLGFLPIFFYKIDF